MKYIFAVVCGLCVQIGWDFTAVIAAFATLDLILQDLLALTNK